jgi:hypothetical protein
LPSVRPCQQARSAFAVPAAGRTKGQGLELTTLLVQCFVDCIGPGAAIAECA